MSKEESKVITDFLVSHIENNHKSQIEVESAIHVLKTNILNLFEHGATLLPPSKIGIVMRVLEIDYGELFYKVLEELAPEISEKLEPIMLDLELSDNEVDELKKYQHFKTLDDLRLKKQRGEFKL